MFDRSVFGRREVDWIGDSHVIVAAAGLRTLSRELDCDVAWSNVTASRSGLHCTTASHFPRPLFFFFRLKKQQHLDRQNRDCLRFNESMRNERTALSTLQLRCDVLHCSNCR
ncbi:unnamed protein product, partial [Nesidiocoris tenuis]